jgi:protoheme IX farnesyltransferase
MALLGIWQVPHYWLVVMRNREDYRRSGVPTILDSIPRRRLMPLLFLWLFCLSVASLNIVLVGLPGILLPAAVIAANAVVMSVVAAVGLLRKTGAAPARFLFHYLNASTLAVAAAVFADSIL